ncbi:MAG: ABZJ_00895 family protein [Gordonia sp. (in: high G+C Gram-positive bacteria)]|jgi:hypothetical protein|nr:ABZJ_00895 family protein [Gordonia sp. (in: high G+C Gram-positive bacteria)]
MSLRPYMLRYTLAATLLFGVFLLVSWAVLWPLAGFGGLLASALAAGYTINTFLTTAGRAPSGRERRSLIAAFIVVSALLDVVPLVVYATAVRGGADDLVHRPAITLGVGGSFLCQMVWIWLVVRFYPEFRRRPDAESARR